METVSIDFIVNLVSKEYELLYIDVINVIYHTFGHKVERITSEQANQLMSICKKINESHGE